MEPTDLTVQILRDIREELRTSREDQATDRRRSDQRIEDLRLEMNQRFREAREESNQRFEAIETTIRDWAEQMVLPSRGIKVAIQDRVHLVEQLEDHEKRLKALESRDHN